MYARRTRAQLLPGAENPLGEREITVAVHGISLETRPVIEADGTQHELRLVRFPGIDAPAAYAYDHELRPADRQLLPVFERP